MQCILMAAVYNTLLSLQAFNITSPENPSILQLAVKFYPPLTEEEVQTRQPARLHAHADMDVLTILHQEQVFL